MALELSGVILTAIEFIIKPIRNRKFISKLRSLIEETLINHVIVQILSDNEIDEERELRKLNGFLDQIQSSLLFNKELLTEDQFTHFRQNIKTSSVYVQGYYGIRTQINNKIVGKDFNTFDLCQMVYVVLASCKWLKLEDWFTTLKKKLNEKGIEYPISQ